MKKIKKPDRKVRLVKEIVRGQLAAVTGGEADPCMTNPLHPRPRATALE